MRKNYLADSERLNKAIYDFETADEPLVGLTDPEYRAAFIDQIIDSEQRVLYTDRLRQRTLDPSSVDPSSKAFHPLKAAIIYSETGDFDEAVWLVFLFVHFGRHRLAGWRYIRDIYGQLGGQKHWTWEDVSNDVLAFRFWLDHNQAALRAAPGQHGFGNHRKYESLNAWDRTGTGEAIESYVEWVHAGGGEHRERFALALDQSPELGFDLLYKSLNDVTRFGRIARFDYLMMLKKLHLLDIVPPHSYLVGASGPLLGARLLFTGDPATGGAREMQNALKTLGSAIDATPDVLEDAVCNWQKSPDRYFRFSA